MMAGGEVAGADFTELRLLFLARRGAGGATGVEGAAGGWVGGIGDIALEDDVL